MHGAHNLHSTCKLHFIVLVKVRTMLKSTWEYGFCSSFQLVNPWSSHRKFVTKFWDAVQVLLAVGITKLRSIIVFKTFAASIQLVQIARTTEVFFYSKQYYNTRLKLGAWSMHSKICQTKIASMLAFFH
jgi:hypothetical protein